MPSLSKFIGKRDERSLSYDIQETRDERRETRDERRETRDERRDPREAQEAGTLGQAMND